MRLHILILFATSLLLSSCSKKGCTDPFAENFEKRAETDDGSCEYLIPEGVLAHYPLDGSAEDISGNGYDGQTEGGVTTTANRHGEAGKAFIFNGEDGRIVVNSAPKVAKARELTISFWYMTDIEGRNQTVTTMSGIDGDGYQGEKFTIRPDLAQVKVDGIWTGIVPFKYDLDEWVHFVMTYDSEEMRLYQNAELVEIERFDGLVDEVSGSSIKIGQHWTGDPQWFDGKIDDLMIWGRALSQAEITTLYRIK